MIACVVLRGPPRCGKEEIAQLLAERLPGRSARIPIDEVWTRWIVRHGDDLAAEAELVYRQTRLLAAAYIRSGYHVVIDGMFAAERDGVAAAHDSDLRELLGLVSTISNVRALLVVVSAPLDVLLARPEAGVDERGVAALHEAIAASGLASPVTIDTGRTSTENAVHRVLDHLPLV